MARKPWLEKCKCFFYDQDTDLENLERCINREKSKTRIGPKCNMTLFEVNDNAEMLNILNY